MIRVRRGWDKGQLLSASPFTSLRAHNIFSPYFFCSLALSEKLVKAFLHCALALHCMLLPRLPTYLKNCFAVSHSPIVVAIHPNSNPNPNPGPDPGPGPHVLQLFHCNLPTHPLDSIRLHFTLRARLLHWACPVWPTLLNRPTLPAGTNSRSRQPTTACEAITQD